MNVSALSMHEVGRYAFESTAFHTGMLTALLRMSVGAPDSHGSAADEVPTVWRQAEALRRLL